MYNKVLFIIPDMTGGILAFHVVQPYVRHTYM